MFNFKTRKGSYVFIVLGIGVYGLGFVVLELGVYGLGFDPGYQIRHFLGFRKHQQFKRSFPKVYGGLRCWDV